MGIQRIAHDRDVEMIRIAQGINLGNALPDDYKREMRRLEANLDG